MRIRHALLLSLPLLLSATTRATASHFYAGLYASANGVLELHRTPEGSLLRGYLRDGGRVAALSPVEIVDGDFKATATYDLSSNGNGGTKFSYLNEYDIPGGPLGKVAGKAIVAASGGEADGSLKRLKQQIEGS